MRKFFTCIFLTIATIALGQQKIFHGTIRDSKGSPLPGVTVTAPVSKTNALTDEQGNFSIAASSTESLLISYQGNQMNYTLGDDLSPDINFSVKAAQMQEVVVTALGIRRTRNQVPYAAQQITGDDVSKNRSSNFLTNLSGRVSGLEIRQNNTIGASTNVVLRGVKSLFGNNQALFVIDGVPFNNANNNILNNPAAANPKLLNQTAGGGGYDYGNAASDINPDDIESVTVLKGAAASALYGSIGANGVILVTTKKGRRGLGITVNSSVSYGSVDKSTLPSYQHSYGGGYGAYYEDPTSHFFYRDVNGDGVPDLITPTTEDASFGAKFDPNLQVYQWDAFDKTSPYYGKSRPWVAAQNDPTTFFEHPVSTNESVMINGGNDKSVYKLGYTRNDEKGILPNSKITKNVLVFSSSLNITPKLTATGNIDFSNINGLGRYGTGYDGSNARNVMTNFREWWEMNVDIKELKDAYFRSGGQNITWNWANPPSASGLIPIYWDNPYFVRYQNYETDSRNRYFGNASLNYKVTDWLNILGRASIDNYTDFQEERKAVSSVGVPYYSRFDNSWNETNFDLLANIDKNISQDFNFKALLGTNIRKQHNANVYAITNGGLIVPGIYALSNSTNAPSAPIEYDGRREVDGVFAGATLSWRNTLTLDGTVRRDATSTLPKGNNTYYYPGASAGFVFSQLLKSQTWLSYGKLRFNYAEVGNDAPIYSVHDIYNVIPPFGSNAQTSVNNFKNNSNLKPEQTKSTEGGLELNFLKSRLGIDVTYYKATSNNQIVPVTLSTATGYSFEYLNSGKVENKGIELSLNGSPVQSKDFSWNITVNYTRNRNKVLALFTDASGNQATNLLLSNFQGGITINATLGQPYGTIRGTDFIYTNGQKTVGSNGRYLKSPTSNEVIGNINPDWIGGINNSFKYKSISLSFLIDVRKGGSVFSTDMYYGLATGLYAETAGLNDLGNPVRNTLANGGGFIRPGVTADGKPNTTRVSTTNYGQFGYSINPDAAFVYDASYIKLREVILSYSLPNKVVSSLKVFRDINFSLIGRNLWIIHKNLPYSDPEEGFSSGNLQGVQTGAYPAVRTLAFNVKLTF